MNARDRLAEAHAGMTADEIAAHALALAGVVEGQDAYLRSLVSSMVETRELAVLALARLADIQTAVRRVQSLAQSHRKREARELLAEIAAIEIFRDPIAPFETSAFAPAETAWPEIFSPKGTRT